MMRFVYILEDDNKLMREMTEALLSIDPKIQVRQFRALQGFVDWIKVLMSEGVAAVKKGGVAPDGFTFEPVSESEEGVLQVVISKVEFLGARQLGLMKKTRELFVRQKICTQEDPTAFVLTAFEDPNFHIRDLKDRILSNIMMKPFDRLILQQHLTFALDGRHPPSKHAVAPYKTSALIEVLKTIQMETLSPIGFTTTSNRLLPPGAVAKYYAKIFVSERQRSLIAKMVDCKPDPKKPDEFISVFSFFGADATQISNLRKKVLAAKSKAIPGPLSIHPVGKKKTCRIVLVESKPDVVQALESTFKRRIEGAEIIQYQNIKELFFEVDPKMDPDAQAGKALSAPGTTQVEIDPKGKITKVDGNPVQFAGQPVATGANLMNWVRQSDKVAFGEWLAAPSGTHFGVWFLGEKSYIVKITHLSQRQFKIEEPSTAEKESYARQKSRLGKGWDFMFVNHNFASLDRMDLWQELLKKGRSLGGEGAFKSFVVAAREYADEEERQMAAVFDDLFFLPVERAYILQKMLLHCQDLGILEDPLEVLSIPNVEEIKSARPAQIEELSEAGLVMKYDRAMSVGSFREFILWQPYEVDAPEINATCNFVEEIGSNEWRLHFVFFAMKDVLLKAIRTWILENYIHSKEG